MRVNSPASGLAEPGAGGCGARTGGAWAGGADVGNTCVNSPGSDDAAGGWAGGRTGGAVRISVFSAICPGTFHRPARVNLSGFGSLSSGFILALNHDVTAPWRLSNLRLTRSTPVVRLYYIMHL